ncbi:MAG TPA: signal peptidase I [Ruminococcaceae bacterium]|nr:signal peptidase I [Oscillospiraceae bacterium]
MNENNLNETTEAAEQEKPRGSFLYETVSVFVTSLVIIAIMFTFLFRFVGVDGESMVPTLSDNDWLIVSAINRNIEQGDIVISTQPNAFNEPIVKRVIAKGGQTVDIDFGVGKVYVDGVELDEPYIAEPTHAMEGNTFPMVVPEGKLFLMGDNRNDSTDSRSPMIGCVDERYILGVVKCRLMPNFTLFSKADK